MFRDMLASIFGAEAEPNYRAGLTRRQLTFLKRMDKFNSIPSEREEARIKKIYNMVHANGCPIEGEENIVIDDLIF